MKASRTFVLATALVLLVPACGGDETQATASATTAGSGGSSSTTTGSGGAGAGGAGGTGGAGTGAAGGAGGSGAAGGAGGTGGGGGGAGGAGGGGGGGGGAPLCDNLPMGPITPTLVTDVLSGSEDLAFDGKGRIAARQGNKIVLVDAASQTTDLVTNFSNQPSYGLRYRPDGNLVVAMPNAGKVVEVTPNGVVTDYVTGLGSPNGLYPDFNGNVWVTEFQGDMVTRINPDKSTDTLVMGANANSANGIVLDPPRSLLFYTNYSEGRIRSLDLSQPSATPTEVVVIQGTRLDGLVMDACGHLYAVDQQNSRLYRIQLDAAGVAVGSPELLATFPTNVANAQFGSGTGFDPLTLYAAGNPGDIYAVPVGVAGAPVPTPP